MRKNIIRLTSILSSLLLLLFFVCIALIRFYPYTYHFTAYPKITRTKFGDAGDPINVIFIGNYDHLMQSFQRAGWLIPDRITRPTSEKIAVDSLVHRSYPTAPVSNLYVFGRVQDLAFERPTNDVQKREHIRLWKTGTLIDGQLTWIGQASYDNGIELSRIHYLPTHHIAPTVDLERNTVGTDLQKTGLVTWEAKRTFTTPVFSAHNGGGDYYESDGDVLVINYTHASIAPIQHTKPTRIIYQLKDNFFLCYDALFTTPLLAFAVSILGLALVVASFWPCLRRIL